MSNKLFRWILVGIVVLIVTFITICCIRYYLQKKNFHSFNLEDLKKQELIIQSIEFKKFIVHGTEMDAESTAHTDELQVFHVSGRADISFVDIDKLKINEDDSDIAEKILRLDYVNDKKKNPFEVNILISEKDVNKVASFESEPVKVQVGSFALQKDLIKPDMTQAEIVQNVSSNLKEEFERQITDGVDPKHLAESDLYQTFLKRLTEIISSLSDWESVEIRFLKKEKSDYEIDVNSFFDYEIENL